MQWFAAWADGSSLIKADDWKDVRRVTAVNQPQLMGDRLYDIRCRGPSNDPRTAEEHASFAERMASTGVQAYGAVSTEEAYRQYLAFLAAYSVQLSSKQVHDHFNADGLDVASEVAAFRAYGDENMLRHGAAISAVAEAIAASRTVISDIITSGRSMTQPWEVLRTYRPGSPIRPAG